MEIGSLNSWPVVYFLAEIMIVNRQKPAETRDANESVNKFDGVVIRTLRAGWNRFEPP